GVLEEMAAVGRADGRALAFVEDGIRRIRDAFNRRLSDRGATPESRPWPPGAAGRTCRAFATCKGHQGRNAPREMMLGSEATLSANSRSLPRTAPSLRKA